MAVKENKALRAVRRIGTLALVAGFLGSAISVAVSASSSRLIAIMPPKALTGSQASARR